MMPVPPEGSKEHFRNLLRRIADGDRIAAGLLVERHGEKVIRMARRRMNQAIRKKFDSEDFTQDMWATFFAHLDEPEKFETEEALSGFLCQIVSNKVISAGRRKQVQLEQDLEVPQIHQNLRTRQSEPSPSQHATEREKWAALKADQPTLTVKLLELRRRGASSDEIASELGISARHVRRVIERRARSAGYDTED